jgi:hypothetical protein
MVSHPVGLGLRATAWFLAWLMAFAGLALAGPAQSADVGLVTQVGGKAVYSDALDVNKPVPVVPFMKIREGDRVTLPQGASVKLVFFAGASQENWSGPVTLTVGKDGGRVEAGPGAARVEVTKIPMQVAEVMQTAPMAATRDNISKGGFVNVRAPKVRPLPFDDEGKAKVAAAREAYAAMRAEAAPDDAYPEWYLTGVLAKYGLYEDMGKLVDDRLAQRPKNAALKQLKARVAAMSKGE